MKTAKDSARQCQASSCFMIAANNVRLIKYYISCTRTFTCVCLGEVGIFKLRHHW